MKFSKDVKAGVQVSRQILSNNTAFPAGECVLEERTRFYKPFNSRCLRDAGGVEMTFKYNHGRGFHNCRILDFLAFKGVPQKCRPGAQFVGNQKKVVQTKDPIRNDYPQNLTAETTIFFANTINIEQKHFKAVM